MSELTTEDKQRIEQEAAKVYIEFCDHLPLPKALFRMAEYATRYEREQQTKVGKTIDETVQIYLPDEYYKDIRKKLVPAIQRLLEAERTELRNKVIDELWNALVKKGYGNDLNILATFHSFKTK